MVETGRRNISEGSAFASPTCSIANAFNYATSDYCLGDTTAVGSYPDGASYYGALDMAGNVMEWASDWFDGNYYSISPASNPTGPATGTMKVRRGAAGATHPGARGWLTATSQPLRPRSVTKTVFGARRRLKIEGALIFDSPPGVIRKIVNIYEPPKGWFININDPPIGTRNVISCL